MPKNKRNIGARRFFLNGIIYESVTLGASDGEVTVREDGTVGITARGSTSMDFSNTGSWRLEGEQKSVVAGGELRLQGIWCATSIVHATIMLGAETTL